MDSRLRGGAPQVGVDDHPGGVDHGAWRHLAQAFDPPGDGLDNLLQAGCVHARADGGAGLIDLLADHVGHPLPGILLYEGLDAATGEHTLNTGQVPKLHDLIVPGFSQIVA